MKIEDLKNKIANLKKKFQQDGISLLDFKFEYIKKIYIKNNLKFFLNEIKTTKDIGKKKELGLEIHNFEKYLKSKFEFLKKKKSNYEVNKTQSFDASILKKQIKYGIRHPLQVFLEKVEKICVDMGFNLIDGPEIELDKYNFTKLNMPKHHPARDMQDTFYIYKKEKLLRSHTSSVQIRILEKYEPPIQYISSGNVYRVDDIDAQHTPMFYQVEGILIDKNISFANLKAMILFLLKEIFCESVSVRFRPSYYPYTEPSAAVDIGCIICNKKGCKTCKYSGWITVLGSGMIHRNVFYSLGYNDKKWTGFAFGIGINRLAMIYYNLPSLNVFYENNISLWKNTK